ncbi:MAG: histidine kinase [Propioniciclava sp.]|uniref:histidine kinase n=1 Tax=Propioniciclava sp. TaxID=2038686 RepID=UPI0039E49DD5
MPVALTRHRRRSWNWRAWVMASVSLLVVTVVAASLVAALTAARDTIAEQSEQRALATARLVASDARYAVWVLAGPPDPAGPVQQAAEQARIEGEVLYVVVTDADGVRYSHPSADLIGEKVSTDPSAALAGQEVTAIEQGTLGRSARGKVPLRDADGQVVGTVSVGIHLSTIDEHQRRLAAMLMLVGAGALGVSFVLLSLLSRSLRRLTHGLELGEMADLLREHAAVLAGALDGVIAADASGRVRLVNDAARRYLGAEVTVGEPADASGLPREVAALLTPGAEAPEPGWLVVVGGRVLLVRRVRAERRGRDLGTVLVLADRTDLDDLGRELEATRGLTDALRAQAHEFTNRLHALAGMLHLGLFEDAEAYLDELTGAASWSHGVQDPYLNGILSAKTAVASESGVELRVSDGTWVEGRLNAPLDAVTVIGNLIDNAIRAAAAGTRTPPWVEVSLLSDGTRPGRARDRQRRRHPRGGA